jgi:hypothetical protein
MIFVEVECRVGWAPDGSGNTYMAQQQANIPGQGTSNSPRIAFMAQVLQFIVAEGVPVAPGSESSVTLANLASAINQCATDLAGSGASSIITPANLATIQGWASGNP